MSKFKVIIDIYEHKLVHRIETKPFYVVFFVKLGRILNHGERMNRIDF